MTSDPEPAVASPHRRQESCRLRSAPYRPQDRRRVRWVVEDQLVSWQQRGVLVQAAARAWVASEPRVGSGRDLHPDLVSGRGTMRGRPQFDCHPAGAIGRRGRMLSGEALEPVADVPGYAVHVDVTHPYEQAAGTSLHEGSSREGPASGCHLRRPTTLHTTLPEQAVAWLRALATGTRGGANPDALLAVGELPGIASFEALLRVDAAIASATEHHPAAGQARANAQAALKRIGASEYAARLLPAATDAPAAHPLAVLSDRERDVVTLLREGLSYAQIARELYVTRSTVAFHLSNAYAKTGTTSRHECNSCARRDNAARVPGPCKPPWTAVACVGHRRRRTTATGVLSWC